MTVAVKNVLIASELNDTTEMCTVCDECLELSLRRMNDDDRFSVKPDYLRGVRWYVDHAPCHDALDVFARRERWVNEFRNRIEERQQTPSHPPDQYALEKTSPRNL